MSDNNYNGWTNYETWNVALWLDNEEGSYCQWSHEAEEVYEDKDRDRDDAVRALADEIEREITDNAPELSGCYSDLLTASLGQVNWYEIAEHYIDDVIERIGPPEEEEAEEDTEEEGAEL